VGYPQMPVGNRSTCRNKVLGRVNDTPAATLVYRLPAHSVPTICPQLQITPVNYSDGFSQLDGVLDLWTRPEIEFESHRGHPEHQLRHRNDSPAARTTNGGRLSLVA
jgi:hypothetical protein